MTTTTQSFDDKGISIPHKSTVPASIACNYADQCISVDVQHAASVYRVQSFGADIYLSGSKASALAYKIKVAQAKKKLRDAVFCVKLGSYRAKAYLM